MMDAIRMRKGMGSIKSGMRMAKFVPLILQEWEVGGGTRRVE